MVLASIKLQNTTTFQSRNSRMTPFQVKELRAEGEYYFNLPYIPSGSRDQFIFAVNQYLFGRFGYGREEERLDELNDWYFDRRSHRTSSYNKQAEACLYRAVYWVAKTEGTHNFPDRAKVRDYSCLSDRVVDRMMAKKMTLGRFLQANVNRMKDARAKIVEGKDKLIKLGRKVTRNALALITGCCPKTVSKHSDIWKTREGSGITRKGGESSREENLSRPDALEITSEKALIRSKREKEESENFQQKNTPVDDLVTSPGRAYFRTDKSSMLNDLRNAYKNYMRHPRHSLLRASPNTS